MVRLTWSDIGVADAGTVKEEVVEEVAIAFRVAFNWRNSEKREREGVDLGHPLDLSWLLPWWESGGAGRGRQFWVGAVTGFW